MTARALPALPALTPKIVLLALVAAVNIGMALYYASLMVTVGPGDDYAIQLEAGQRMLAGENPYADTGVWEYRYSPLIAWLYAITEPLGASLWWALHFAALALLPMPAVLILGASWPFWMDMWHTNWMGFVAVAGFLALRGNAYGQAAFLVLTLLIPRPLMMPLAAWVVWQRRTWWPWLVAGLAGYSGLVWLTGWGEAWITQLLSVGDVVPITFAPAYWLGLWWYVIAPPAVVFLMWKRRWGLAGIAASPYWVIYYFTILVWELVPQQRAQHVDD